MDKEKEFWNNRYGHGGDSGYGSYGDQKDLKMRWLSGLDISSITSIGCGDFYFDGHVLDDLYPKASYIGIDNSNVIVDRNKMIYPTRDFRVFDGSVPPADLIMCIDVLFHMYDEQEVKDLLEKLKGSWTKYLAITAYERDEEMNEAGHVRIRKFDPSFFGTPIIRQIVEEDGSLFFFLFKK